MASKNIKGYAFEWFVRKILNYCGFTSVVPDNEIVFRNGRNVMVHGLGQPHNTDVLVDPPIQIPFFFPSRLIIECKCKNAELGIEHGRNVFGLREDINGFDVVTPDILHDRANYRRRKPATYNFDRYYYQVALASTSGFKLTTQEFAAVHRIPLLQFKSSLFSSVVGLIYELDNIQMNQFDKEKMLDAFAYSDDIAVQAKACASEVLEWSQTFSKECETIAQRMNIGILDNGSILFLFKPYSPDKDETRAFADGYSLHWSTNHNYWSLYENGVERYCFELPIELLRIWANNYNVDRREAALQLKEGYMKNITIYTKSEDAKISITALTLSSTFINYALREYEHQQ